MYTVYPTAVAAIAANAEAAKANNCNMVNTFQWYARINHPTDGRSALKDGVGQVTLEQLEGEGWFQQQAQE